MASASACARPMDEECFNDAEQRAGPVSPSRQAEAPRSPLEAPRRLRPRIPAWATQRREAAISTLSQQRTATNPIRIRDSQARGRRGGTQSHSAALEGDIAALESERGLRCRDFGTPGGARGQVRDATSRASSAHAARPAGRSPGIAAKGALAAIRIYQATVSPGLGNVCRYAPSCSHYASEAIERHGLVKGAWLGMKRLLRCRPWGGSGYDPVPD